MLSCSFKTCPTFRRMVSRTTTLSWCITHAVLCTLKQVSCRCWRACLCCILITSWLSILALYLGAKTILLLLLLQSPERVYDFPATPSCRTQVLSNKQGSGPSTPFFCHVSHCTPYAGRLRSGRRSLAPSTKSASSSIMCACANHRPNNFCTYISMARACPTGLVKKQCRSVSFAQVQCVTDTDCSSLYLQQSMWTSSLSGMCACICLKLKDLCRTHLRTASLCMSFEEVEPA